MNVGIIGVGAVGGMIGARLANIGVDVTFIDVGEQQQALRERGIVLESRIHERIAIESVKVRDLAEADPQDLLILAVKAYKLVDIAAAVPRLCHDETVILPVQNGFPWWYFQGLNGTWSSRRLDSLDSEGLLQDCIAQERLLGAVVYPAAEVISPGVVRHVEGSRIVVGELDDKPSQRAQKVIELFKQAGFKSFFLDDLRGEVWLKLIGSAVFNPLSALTGATMAEMCRHPASRALAIDLMEEIHQVASAFNIVLRVPIEKRLAGAERVGDHKTSTLQDVERGERLEVDALIGAVVEIARWVNVATPKLDTVAAATYLLDQSLRKKAQDGHAVGDLNKKTGS